MGTPVSPANHCKTCTCEKRPPGRPKGDGLCPMCKINPRPERRGYCPPCQNDYSSANQALKRVLAIRKEHLELNAD